MSWKKLASRTVYENAWMTVLEDKVIDPAGNRHDYGYVHFKSKAVAIVPLDEKGNTWLVGQHRYTLGEYSWEVPMGGSEPGEDPAQTAARELREETGLTAASMTRLMRLHTSNSITDEEGFVFIARELTAGATDFDAMEDLSMRKLPLSDAVAMVRRGEITDAISIAALLRVAEAEPGQSDK